MKNLTLKQKIGQMFIWGVEGTTLTPSLAGFIRAHDLGGIILFKRNIESPEQIGAFNRDIQNIHSPLPFFISVDQEGGRVSRLGKPFTQFPPAALWAQKGKIKNVLTLSRIMAEELKLVGINMDYTPILDINTNPLNPVIGDRSFGNDPETVARIALTLIKVFQKHKIITVGKHFPGHGDTIKDSHLELPVVNKDLKHLNKVELYPFRQAIAQDLPAIMTAHVLYPQVDARMPATFSSIFLQKILRKNLGHKGLIISDDLVMKGATSLGNITEIIIKAVLAGVDILLICHEPETQEQAFEELIREAEKSKTLKTRINAAVKRILETKEQYLKNFPSPDLKQIKSKIGSRQYLVDDAINNSR